MKNAHEVSPYAIGAGLGALNAFAFATAERGLGITTAFESSAALAEQKLAPDATHINAYLSEREEKPKLGWEALLVAGVLAGSFLAARGPARAEPARAVPEAWERRFGASRGKRYAAAFLGGAVMMMGARMAKGCTSGHCLTGNAQLAASSWLFSPVMMASALLTTRLLYGKGEDDGDAR